MKNFEFSVFEAVGIEIEYMLVNPNDLKVSPVCDKILQSLANTIVNEVELGEIAVSNELVNHVIELKTNGPYKLNSQPLEKTAKTLDDEFHKATQKLIETAATLNATLLGTGAHPLMNPGKETVLWPHGQTEIYSAYNRIFNCSGHGWANLQSVHINLPFQNESQFIKLHAAIRAVIPFIPALASSTPVFEGKACTNLDQRIFFYSENQKKVPQIAGQIIPEPVTGYEDYEMNILQPMYSIMKDAFNAEVLCDEWLNSRGAIARFDRGAIEIRLIDTQESSSANIAVAVSVINAVIFFYENFSTEKLNAIPTEYLAGLLWKCVHSASAVNLEKEQVLITAEILSNARSGREFWNRFIPDYSDFKSIYESQGTLAERIINRLQHDNSAENILSLYSNLNQALLNNNVYR